MLDNKKVIFFDLFSTLISLNDHNSHIARASDSLGIDRDLWNRTSMSQYHDRRIGLVKEPFDIVANIARAIDSTLSDKAIEEAMDIRIQRFHHCVTRPEASVLRALDQLKASGYRLGLISNADVIDIMGWPASPLSPYFESVLFSCEIGMAKPDRAIYEKAMSEMEVRPEECVFVGDGGSNELAGARGVGMTTVLTTQYRWQKDGALQELEKDADYTISNLKELVAMGCDLIL